VNFLQEDKAGYEEYIEDSKNILQYMIPTQNFAACGSRISD
jgi:hypothetical protein